MKRYKVVLYNPAAVFYTMPLALLAVGSALDPQRFQVVIVDGRLEKNALNRVLTETTDALCLGITVLTGSPIRDALKISRAVKASHPNVTIIWGGWHPSLFPGKTLLDIPEIDITVQGQGELTFSEVVGCLAMDGDLAEIPGIAFRENAQVIQNPPRPLTDMNRLEPLNYHLINVEKYFQLKGRRQLDYISSTGCFFRCAFCADPFVYNRKWTAIEPQRIGEEIECLSKTYRIDDIDFQDETFFTYRKRVVEIAEQFLRRNLSITWAATMRADQGHRMSDEDFAFCARSGLRRVLIGVESGSQEMIDRIQKDIKLEYVLECAGKCLRHNIAAIFPFIVGFPGESEESVHDTLNMAKKLRAMHPKFDTPIFYFKPYPGSLITQEAEKNGYRQPGSTEEWADFDYVGSSGPWVSKDKYKLVERFKFYNRIGWGENHWYAAPLRRLARWRCRHNFYDFPLEKILMGRIRPVPRLS